MVGMPNNVPIQQTALTLRYLFFCIMIQYVAWSQVSLYTQLVMHMCTKATLKVPTASSPNHTEISLTKKKKKIRYGAGLKDQLTRNPYPFPKLHIKDRGQNIDGMGGPTYPPIITTWLTEQIFV